MIYKITLSNNIKVLSGAFIYNIVFIAFYYYAIHHLDNSYGVFTLIFFIHYGVSMLPTVFLHIEYYLRNTGDIVEINDFEKTITINDEIIRLDELEKIVIFMSPAWHRKSVIRLWPFEEYRYAKILKKTGEKYIFSCLMGFDVDKIMATISNVVIEKKVRLIATPLIN